MIVRPQNKGCIVEATLIYKWGLFARRINLKVSKDKYTAVFNGDVREGYIENLKPIPKSLGWPLGYDVQTK